MTGWARTIRSTPSTNRTITNGKGSLVMANEKGIDQAKKGDIANFNDLTTFAVIKDGKWYEKGEMGWWGACVSNEKDKEVWYKEFHKILEEQDPETLLTLVDCHI